jgi:predicted transcriptional regulator
MSAHEKIKLPPDLEAYTRDRPSKAVRQAQGIDGSAMELRLVSTLHRAGFREEEIIDYFRRHRLPRYVEEAEATGSDSWLRSLIRRAQRSHEGYTPRETPEGGSTESVADGLTTHPTRVTEIDHNPSRRVYDSAILRFLVLKARREAEDRGDPPLILTRWREEIVAVSRRMYGGPVSFKTAQRLSDSLLDSGYVRLEKLDGKRKAICLTEKGRRLAVPIGRFSRFVPLSRDAVARSAEDGPRARQPQLLPPPSKPMSRNRKPRSRGNGWKQRRHQFRKENLINDYYRLSFTGNKIRYIQLLTPPEEWRGALVWAPVVAGYDDADVPIYTTILAPEDVGSPIHTVLPHAWTPRWQVFAAAVELLRDDNRFRVAEYADENGELHPSIGVIMQSWRNFFGPLNEANLSERAIRVKPTGRRRPKMGNRNFRAYEFSDAGSKLHAPLEFDFEAFLGDLAGDHHVARILALPAGWFAMPPKRRMLTQRLTGEM